MTQSRSRALLVALAAISIAGCGNGEAAANTTTAGSGGPGRPGNGPGGGGPAPVEVAVVERTAISRTSTVAGQLSPLRAAGVTSQVAGALLSVRVEEGSRVAEGDVLAELDARELTAQVKAAEANVAFARSTAERSETLYRSRAVTTAEFERDQAALAAAEASLAQLQTRLGFTKVRAPMTGVVTQRFVQAGDIVGNQTRLFTVADLSTLVALLPVSELEVPFLRAGIQVPVQVDALGRTVTGRIRRIFPAADSVNRLVPVEVAVAGDAVSGLRPGYTVRVTLRLDERQGVLTVPSRAVVGAAGAQSVYLVRDGRAERRRVRVGADLDGRMEVVEGLAFGDTVVTTGNALLRDGAQLRIVQPLAPEAPARTPTPVGGTRP